ncbi:acetyl-CoA synthetase-like protein [Piromyces finnis]|uniref:Acetyl-CoA synthetase-like protein n=1 Tax=Piromyces finnis TaxID=1754191 RepID=A0A1Y1VHB9_9FUNG|nr:acetyl-CoA synthetase-like protein [Piromyces finnis]|eukprot:ORX55841.1 acetyl-CoA synthetase-like protein [Piromyces finnis]
MTENTNNNNPVNVDKDDISNRGYGANLYPEFSRPINEENVKNPPGAIEMTKYPKKDGEGKPRRIFVSEDWDTLYGEPIGVNSLLDNLELTVKKSPNNRFLGSRQKNEDGTFGEYEWQTYSEFYEHVKRYGAYFNKKLNIQKGSFIGIIGINSLQWAYTMFGTFYNNGTIVPLYDTLGITSLEMIIEQTEMNMIASSAEKIKLLASIPNFKTNIKTLIAFTQPSDEDMSILKELGVNVITLEDIEKEVEADASFKTDPIEPELEDTALICYTSGTTGKPKGVVLTHRNMLCFVGSVYLVILSKQLYQFDETDCYISYLPLAHVFEQAIFHSFVFLSARIGFYTGSVKNVMSDINALKPTCFITVPRLLNRVYGVVNKTIATKPAIVRFLFNWACKSKMRGLTKGKLTHWLWDGLVFKSIREKLGGEIKVMLVGSAPLSSDVMDFMRISFSCEIFEGYGSTETVGCISLTRRNETEAGNNGVPWPCCEIKLRDIPEMNYTSEDKPFPRGEIMVKGPNVFKEYYKMPEVTADTKDEEGWCHTGDIGMWDEKGRLKIIDRVKNIFKLAQGEYVAPEKIENVLINHELVEQAFVHGESLQNSLVGVIVPDEPEIRQYALNTLQVAEADTMPLKDLYSNPELKKAMLTELDKHCRANDLKGFECLRNIVFETEPFSTENNLLTPVFKLKRNVAIKKYRKAIDQMYLEMERV